MSTWDYERTFLTEVGRKHGTQHVKEGHYGGFFSVIDCDCGYDNHVEGDVSSGEEIRCEGCHATMIVTGR